VSVPSRYHDARFTFSAAAQSPGVPTRHLEETAMPVWLQDFWRTVASVGEVI